MLLSVIIPAFNEEKTIGAVIDKVLSTTKPINKKQIIVVDDGSSDKTAKVVKKLKRPNVELVTHKYNLGKGAAVRSALTRVKGDFVVIQDADLEYDPDDWQDLLSPLIHKKAEVVFGSRFIGHGPHRVLYFWHQIANQGISLLSNIFTNLNLSDIETGAKAFTKNVARKLKIVENGFGFEPEFTARVAKMKVPVYEVGISYSGRTYDEGKKITWIDGIKAIFLILKYNIGG